MSESSTATVSEAAMRRRVPVREMSELMEFMASDAA
jgi:hypothetical protein